MPVFFLSKVAQSGTTYKMDLKNEPPLETIFRGGWYF